MKMNKKRGLFVGLLVIGVSIGILEMILGLLAFMSPRVEWLLSGENVIPDPRLGHRPRPGVPGHDRNGFRNPEVPNKASIVVLGDSQTYGTGVAPKDAWPRKLGSMSGKTVYSMAYGGYGPTHSLALWDEAVAFSPDIIIEAFYVGNDLIDSFRLVYNKGQFPDLKSPEPKLQESVRELEQSKPIHKLATQMFSMRTNEETTNVSLWRSLLQRSRLWVLFSKAWDESVRLVNMPNTPKDQWEAAKAFAGAHPESSEVFNDGPFKTIFTSAYRLLAIDLNDPRVLEGLQISLRAMRRMHELAAKKNIRFIVVLIPTKETVFRRLWKDPPAGFRRTVENEERVWKITKDFLEYDGIEYFDTLPVLREQLMSGGQPYQVSYDGHPNEHGHMAIAKLVAAHLSSLKTSQRQAEQQVAANMRMPN